MSKRKIEPKISNDGCKGCLICVYICEDRGAGILKESDNRTPIGGVQPKVDGECIGCRWCERICPDFAISLEEIVDC